MRRLMPSRMDLLIFAALAVVCAGIVSSSESTDVGLSLMSIPVFITGSLLGMLRSGHLASLGKIPSGAAAESSDQP
jgi:hypothetical protein